MRKLALGSPGATIDAKIDWCIRAIKEIERASHDVSAEQTADAFSLSNVTETRTLDADSTTLAEVADVLCTFIQDLKKRGQKRS